MPFYRNRFGHSKLTLILNLKKNGKKTEMVTENGTFLLTLKRLSLDVIKMNAISTVKVNYESYPYHKSYGMILPRL